MPGVRECGSRRWQRTAEVHDALDAGGAGCLGERLRRGALAGGERSPARPPGGGLHRVDQVIGHLHSPHRADYARTAERVPDLQLEVLEAYLGMRLVGDRFKRQFHARSVAGQGAHLVALLEQARQERRAGEAADAGKEHTHPTIMTCPCEPSRLTYRHARLTDGRVRAVWWRGFSYPKNHAKSEMEMRTIAISRCECGYLRIASGFPCELRRRLSDGPGGRTQAVL